MADETLRRGASSSFRVTQRPKLSATGCEVLSLLHIFGRGGTCGVLMRRGEAISQMCRSKLYWQPETRCREFTVGWRAVSEALAVGLSQPLFGAASAERSAQCNCTAMQYFQDRCLGRVFVGQPFLLFRTTSGATSEVYVATGILCPIIFTFPP